MHAHHDMKLCQTQKEAKCSDLKATVCSIQPSVNSDCGDGVRTILRDTVTTEAPCVISLNNTLPKSDLMP